MTKDLIEALQASLFSDTRAFLPELHLCAAIVLFLLIRLVPRFDRRHLGWIGLIVSTFICYLAWQQWLGDAYFDPRVEMPDKPGSLSLFGGMLVFDNFAIFLKLFLYTFLPLVILLCLLTGIPDSEDSADFLTLLFGATLGMSIMASSNHLLMVFIGVEMASLPSYALAGFLKGRRQSSEAALKYVVYGGGASGVMLYGISLVAGRFGTGYLPELVRMIEHGGAHGGFNDPVVLMGMFFILVGLGFKLAAVPFHFWCPDVFEGAAAEVGAFLSVASKGAALALFARITLGLGGLSGDPATTVDFNAWRHSAQYLVPILSIFAVVTTTFGNLAAYGQTNLKRLLAYSTIAHAGFMMMGIATMTKEGAAAMLFYLITYLFMNLGAFTVVAFMRNMTGHEDLSYFRGFVYRAPLLVIALAVFLLSLLGMPPLAGFAAKFQIFYAIFDAGQEYAARGQPALSYTMYAVLLAGGLNTVLSLFYYVKVLKVMILEKTLEEVENRAVAQMPFSIVHASYATILALSILVLGILWNPLAEAATRGIDTFRSLPDTPAQPVAQLDRGGN